MPLLLHARQTARWRERMCRPTDLRFIDAREMVRRVSNSRPQGAELLSAPEPITRLLMTDESALALAAVAGVAEQATDFLRSGTIEVAGDVHLVAFGMGRASAAKTATPERDRAASG